MIVLESKKARALKGKDNKRLKSSLLVGNESTAAWADVEKLNLIVKFQYLQLRVSKKQKTGLTMEVNYKILEIEVIKK